MKITLQQVRTNFPGCIPCQSDNIKASCQDDALCKVRFHLGEPDSLVIQALEVTCECCGESGYYPVGHLGKTRKMLKL
ncbi:MAG: hypothetical protein IJX99_03910 [Clostridia bacterium]|nr:hypothetical protein [Clostridia bacterium]